MKKLLNVRYIYFEVIWTKTSRNIVEDPHIWNENILLLKPKHINSTGWWGTRNTTEYKRRDENNLDDKNAYVKFYKHVDQNWIDLKKFKFNVYNYVIEDVVLSNYNEWVKKALEKLKEKIEENEMY